MSNDLLVIVPSRGRPKNIARLLDSVHTTRKLDTHVHVAVDDDDPELDRYRYVMDQAAQDGDRLTVGPRQGLTGWTNEIALSYAAEYQFLASFGDDHVPRTNSWDYYLTSAITRRGNGTGFSYPWDGTRNDIPEAVVMSSDIVTALGWMALPACQHWYIDCAWADLGQSMGCLRYLRAVAVDHVKNTDETAKDSSKSLAADRDAYFEWRSTQMGEDVRTLLDLIGAGCD